MNSDSERPDDEVQPTGAAADSSPYRPPPEVDDGDQPVELPPESEFHGFRVAVASAIFALLAAALTNFLEAVQFGSRDMIVAAVTVPGVLLGLFALTCAFYFSFNHTAAVTPLVWKTVMAMAAAPASLVVFLPACLAAVNPVQDEANIVIAFWFAYFVSAFVIASFFHRIAANPG